MSQKTGWLERQIDGALETYRSWPQTDREVMVRISNKNSSNVGIVKSHSCDSEAHILIGKE